MATRQHPEIHLENRFQSLNPLQPQPPCSLPVTTTGDLEKETSAFRNAKVLDKLPIVPEEGIHTIGDLVRRGARKFGDHHAIGFRTETLVHTTEGPAGNDSQRKQLMIPELSPYKFLSYIEYEELVNNVGWGLVECGLLPSQDKLCMWAQTR